MGNFKSKAKNTNNNHKIIKLKNISANLKKNFSLNENINEIITDIFSDNFNIIVLEGLNDKSSVITFYKKFQEMNNLNNGKYKIIPSTEDFTNTASFEITDSTSIEISWGSETKKQAKYSMYNKIIITDFEIRDYSFYDLYNSTSQIIKNESVLICNIKSDNKIYSIYTCTLTPNLLYVNTESIRNAQLVTLSEIININSKNINNNSADNNINIVMSELEIPNWINDEINYEYINIIQKHYFLDLSSMVDNDIKNKTSYILFKPHKHINYKNKQLNEINEIMLKSDSIFVMNTNVKYLPESNAEIIDLDLMIKFT